MLRLRVVVPGASFVLAACTNDYTTFTTNRPDAADAGGASPSAASSSGGPGGATGQGGGPASSAASGPGSSGSGAATGGGGSGGTGEPPACPAYATLSDDFGDGAVGPQWKVVSSPPATVGGELGELVITVGDNSNTSDHFAGYASTAKHDLTNCEVLVAVHAVPDIAQDANAFFGVFEDPEHGIFLNAIAGSLRCRVHDGDVTTPLADVPWDASAYKWWRLRESAGVTSCETSSDGKVWSTLAQISSPPAMSSGTVVLEAGSFDVVANAGQARFDDVNRPPP